MSLSKFYPSLSSLFLWLLITPLQAQLAEGDLMFVAYNADGSDGFAVVVLKEIPANTTIYFCDNEWNEMPIGSGGEFNDQNEGELTWDSGGTELSAGTVVLFNEISSASNPGYGVSFGLLSGSTTLSGTNEVLYAFIGSDVTIPSTFLSAFANDNFNSTNGSLVNTGLSAGVNAIEISGDEDVCLYSASINCNGTVADCATMIADPSNWTTQDGTGDQSTDMTFPDFPDDVPGNFGGSALPVILLDFSAEKSAMQHVVLEWITAMEINNAYFEIQRSADGIIWTNIDRIEGAINSQENTYYSYTDKKVPGGSYYYRLKQIDLNGSFSYSELVQIKIDMHTTFNCYPNPASEFIIIQFDSTYGWLTITKTDGQRMYHSSLPQDESNCILDTHDWPSGNYIISLQSKLGIHQELVLIQ